MKSNLQHKGYPTHVQNDKYQKFLSSKIMKNVS
eukprot:UN13041